MDICLLSFTFCRGGPWDLLSLRLELHPPMRRKCPTEKQRAQVRMSLLLALPSHHPHLMASQEMHLQLSKSLSSFSELRRDTGTNTAKSHTSMLPSTNRENTEAFFLIYANCYSEHMYGLQYNSVSVYVWHTQIRIIRIFVSLDS